MHTGKKNIGTVCCSCDRVQSMQGGIIYFLKRYDEAVCMLPKNHRKYSLSIVIRDKFSSRMFE